jgi:hypothetical protein
MARPCGKVSSIVASAIGSAWHRYLERFRVQPTDDPVEREGIRARFRRQRIDERPPPHGGSAISD